ISFIYPYYTSKHAKPFGHIGGLGLSIYNDIAGENNNFKTTGVNANFGYNLPLDRNFKNVVSFGLQVGMIQKRVDTSTLLWGEQYDPWFGVRADITASEISNFANKAFVDIGSGIFWFYTPLPEEGKKVVSMNSGISVSHMNNPDESMLEYDPQRLPLLYKYHGGIVFGITRNFTTSLNVLFAYQDGITQENIGTYFSYKFFTNANNTFAESIVRLGGWYRVNDAVIMLTEVETIKFKVAFSYDWNTSSLRYRDRGVGTYELHFGIKFTQHAPPKSRY
ncbi:MAG: PorP/SprF family type IX secretion system membrane protein, partial [Cyclobacteriaceae bacterium]|nr:PorP/SprF family type IX secretion system membrane protein [Cyclobacteriaceae bacterium]